MLCLIKENVKEKERDRPVEEVTHGCEDMEDARRTHDIELTRRSVPYGHHRTYSIFTPLVNTHPTLFTANEREHALVIPPILSVVACVKNIALTFFHPLLVCRCALVVPSPTLNTYFPDSKVMTTVGPVSDERPVMVEEDQFIALARSSVLMLALASSGESW